MVKGFWYFLYWSKVISLKSFKDDSESHKWWKSGRSRSLVTPRYHQGLIISTYHKESGGNKTKEPIKQTTARCYKVWLLGVKNGIWPSVGPCYHLSTSKADQGDKEIKAGQVWIVEHLWTQTKGNENKETSTEKSSSRIKCQVE